MQLVQVKWAGNKNKLLQQLEATRTALAAKKTGAKTAKQGQIIPLSSRRPKPLSQKAAQPEMQPAPVMPLRPKEASLPPDDPHKVVLVKSLLETPTLDGLRELEKLAKTSEEGSPEEVTEAQRRFAHLERSLTNTMNVVDPSFCNVDPDQGQAALREAHELIAMIELGQKREELGDELALLEEAFSFAVERTKRSPEFIIAIDTLFI